MRARAMGEWVVGIFDGWDGVLVRGGGGGVLILVGGRGLGMGSLCPADIGVGEMRFGVGRLFGGFLFRVVLRFLYSGTVPREEAVAPLVQ